MAKAEFYTYIHRKADTGEVFYVGKGKGQRATTIYNRTKYWQNVVKKHGFVVEISSVFDIESDALDDEVRLIEKLRNEGVRLVNLTNGGEGASGQVFTDDRRKKISLSLTGKTIPEEVRKKISASLSGRKAPKRTEEHQKKLADSRRGRATPDYVIQKIKAAKAANPYIPTEETRAKLSLSGIGRKLTDEQKQKLRIANLGNTHSLGVKRSEETKNKMSASQRGKVRSEDARRNMREGAKNRPAISADTRLKMSLAHKEAWIKRKAKHYEANSI